MAWRLHLFSVGSERRHRGAKHRAIETLMLWVSEDDENLHGDWPLTDAVPMLFEVDPT
jgi:hypothetical protein